LPTRYDLQVRPPFQFFDHTGFAIEPGKTVKLAPGGYHLMMMDLKNPLKQGDKLPITLEFEKAGKVQVCLDVEGVGAQGPTASPSSGSKKGMKGMSPGMKM
jgi:copper(I)-binding protein